jgi:hypothetical protein
MVFESPHMAMMTLDDLLQVAELMGLIMDELPLSALVALSFTSKAKLILVQDYMWSKLMSITSPFGLDATRLMEHLAMTSSVIVGSIALKAVAPAALQISTDNLDIAVPSGRIHVFDDWLTKRCGYKPSKSVTESRKGILFCYTFICRIDDRDMKVNILGVANRSQAHELAFYSSNTASMNMITSRGLFTAYRTLLNRKLMVANHVSNMVPMTRYQVRERLSKIADSNNAKTQSRGFTLLNVQPIPHTYELCQCKHVSACPSTIRYTRDPMGSFLRLLDQAEYEAISVRGDPIPTYDTQLPPIFWRLADVELGSQGFAFHLSDDRIAHMVM